MSIITVMIDLAKNVFAVHGVNDSGRADLVKPRVSHDQLVARMKAKPKSGAFPRLSDRLPDYALLHPGYLF